MRSLVLSRFGMWVFPLLYVLIFTLFQLRGAAIPLLVLMGLPFLILLTYLYFFRFPRFLDLLVCVTPLSVNIEDVGGGMGLSLPYEPFLLMAFVAALYISIRQPVFSRDMLRHPVTLIIMLQCAWLLITTLNSSFHEISMKLLVIRFIYLFTLYFFMAYLFRKVGNVKRFLLLYVAGFIPVILYSLYSIGKFGFARPYSPVMSQPFYSDHTILGACLAMLLPVVYLYFANRRVLLRKTLWMQLSGIVLLILFSGLIFSYSRAAWLSILLATGVGYLLRKRVSFGLFAGGLILLVSSTVLFAGDIAEAMRQNTEQKSGDSFFMHAQSVTNVESDESNLERINRWNCAMRMYAVRPIMGFGPGTYERNYGRFQATSEMTRISTFDGDRGDAHSEYLTALSEQGMPGFIIWCLLVLSLMGTGMRVAYRAMQPEVRILAAGIFLGLVTYFFHGAVNSFLDIDKAAGLFWPMAAMLVVLDTRHLGPAENAE